MGRKPYQSGSRGFTLVEMLIVLLVLIIAVEFALPAMNNLFDANRLSSEARRLLSAIYLTRSEAVVKNTPVRMCPSPMARTGERTCSGIYADGWIIFADVDGDREPDAGEPILSVYSGLPEGYALTNRRGTRNAAEMITYLPDGTSHRNRTLMLCATGNPEIPSWSIVMNIVGRPRMAREWGDCPERGA